MQEDKISNLWIKLDTNANHNVTNKYFRLDWTRHFVTFTYHTSAEYIFPFTLCSDPSLSLSPQWKWNCSNLYFFANGPPDNSTIKDTTAHFIVFVSRSPSSLVFSRLSTWLSHKKACSEISAETSMQRSKKLFIAEIFENWHQEMFQQWYQRVRGRWRQACVYDMQLISENLDGAHNRLQKFTPKTFL